MKKYFILRQDVGHTLLIWQNKLFTKEEAESLLEEFAKIPVKGICDSYCYDLIEVDLSDDSVGFIDKDHPCYELEDDGWFIAKRQE